jgi:hypothetical protein
MVPVSKINAFRDRTPTGGVHRRMRHAVNERIVVINFITTGNGATA